MKKIPCPYFIAALSASMLLGACGGSGSSSNYPSTANYQFVVPALNSQRVYNETITDNAQNQINLSYTETVTAVNANGTYSVQTQDPSNNSITVNGTNYSVQPVVTTYNSSGQPLSTYNNTTKVTCTYTPFGPGPGYPTELDVIWTGGYNETCGSTVTTYSQSGSVVEVQSVTVPAGTFNALVTSSSLTFVDAAGITNSQVLTSYRDVPTGALLQQVDVYSYSAAPSANGYPVSVAIALKSGTP